MRTLTPGMVAQIRRANVVLYEDADTIVAVGPCPTAAHRPDKVAPEYRVTFRCPHGEHTHVFCGPCTAVRRIGRYACVGNPPGQPLADQDCPGAAVVEVSTLHPAVCRKGP